MFTEEERQQQMLIVNQTLKELEEENIKAMGLKEYNDELARLMRATEAIFKAKSKKRIQD